MKHDSVFPLVSVAIISFNQENVIEQTLVSVLRQTYRNIEIIVGDDASTDKTPEKIESILSMSGIPYLLIRRKENLGITQNLNDVISNCRGKYIALLGGDDMWVTKKIETSVAYLENNLSASFLCHGSIVVDQNGGEIGESIIPAERPVLFDGLAAFEGRHKFYGSAQVIRNADDLPRFDDRIIYASDLIYASVLIEKKGPGLAVPDLLTVYRKSPKGVTIGKWAQVQEDGLQAAMILAFRNPSYGRAAVSRCASIFYSNAVRLHREGKFAQAADMALTSLIMKFRLKTLIRWMALRVFIIFRHAR